MPCVIDVLADSFSLSLSLFRSPLSGLRTILYYFYLDFIDQVSETWQRGQHSSSIKINKQHKNFLT